jgi:hypothetical protein
VPPAADQTLPIQGSLRAVAGDGATVFALVEASKATSVQALRGGQVTWRVALAGAPTPALATNGALVAAAVSASSEQGLRGDPGAIVTLLSSEAGAKQGSLAFDSTEWAIITAIAPYTDGFVVAGHFGGTLRAGTRVVTSAGGSDGFVARIAARGELAWLIRTGGAGADGVHGIATRGDRIAIAGTFTAGAELGGLALPPYNDRSPFGDVFAAELDGAGARRWVTTFGGRADDAVAGVTIDGRGNVVVAASARDVVSVGSAQLVTQGEGDGVLAWFGEGGEQGAAVLVGGLDFDGLRDITSVGDKTVVGGFFSGSIKLGERTLTAGGGDDAFIAAFDANGTVATSWHVGGDGREDIAALEAIPGGFVAGIAHTAKASVDDAPLAAPKDPLQGSAVIVRGVR